MKFSVFQINLTNSEIDEINNSSGPMTKEKFAANEKYAAYTRATFSSDPDRGLAMGYYEKVCEIEAANLNEVFEFGNIGPEEAITRLARMHSLSVGDIIEDEAGERVVVASFGFDKVVDNKRVVS